jgi:hypothetical protein
MGDISLDKRRQDTIDVINKVLSYALHRELREDVIAEYIDNWLVAKAPWLKRFNGTIYTYPEKIECTLNEEAKKAEIQEFLHDVESHFGIYPPENMTFSFAPFREFIELQGTKAAENLVVENYICPDGTKIPAGMKLLRAFKYFFNDKETLTRDQDAMNLVISKTKLSGYFHISVDPLDYLSVSENSHGWRSCHSLDGDYAAGNIEYMMDKMTLVCYVDDNTITKINNFPDSVPWNSKKWRMLLFCHPEGETMFAGRQYPDSMTGMLEIVQKAIQQIFPENFYAENWENDWCQKAGWKDKYKNHFSFRVNHIASHFDGCVYPIHTLYQPNNISKLFYDDINLSHIYTKPYYLFGQNRTMVPRARTLKPVIVGGTTVTCPQCGKHLIAQASCWDCLYDEMTPWVCSCCNRRFQNEDDGLWTVDEEWWCNDCVSDNCVICADCGGVVNYDDAYWDEEEQKYYCRECWEYR